MGKRACVPILQLSRCKESVPQWKEQSPRVTRSKVQNLGFDLELCHSELTISLSLASSLVKMSTLTDMTDMRKWCIQLAGSLMFGKLQVLSRNKPMYFWLRKIFKCRKKIPAITEEQVISLTSKPNEIKVSGWRQGSSSTSPVHKGSSLGAGLTLQSM